MKNLIRTSIIILIIFGFSIFSKTSLATSYDCRGGKCAALSGTAPDSGQGVQIGSAFNFNFSGTYPRTFGEFVTNILPPVYTMSLLILLVYIVWGSFKYLMAGGDPKAVQAARAHITWAIVGMVFIFISYGLFQLVNSALGSVF